MLPTGKRFGTQAWQSHLINKRLLRRFTPRNDALLNAFVLVNILSHALPDFGSLGDIRDEDIAEPLLHEDIESRLQDILLLCCLINDDGRHLYPSLANAFLILF
jgi:hypothetical protein